MATVALKTIVAMRFSALGDAAMTIPVMRKVLEANPGIQIVFVSNRNWEALCLGIPRLHFHPADLKGAHKDLKGLYRLFKELRTAYKVDAVADLHNVLRSKVVRTLFRLTGVPVKSIDKGRAEKKALTRKEHKELKQLTSTVERYALVFRQLGYECTLDALKPEKQPQIIQKGEKKWVGIAPFATYREKMYPLEKMEDAIAALWKKGTADLLLFGGGKSETAMLKELAARYPGVQVVAGRFSLAEELSVISQLDVMVSMDSANMHLASLFAVPVVSVWGATHPYAGFMGYGQSESNAVQIDLYCRPCSVFGNKPCYRGDHACMENLPSAAIVKQVEEICSL
ncbi:glycosyltransferase family 9 protein [Chitinophaga horti]|uniref:Glycosyltransferase family 9 protein n=1 Tax=Chitinophaga horti TaxID=2920382 RepID=A0ABY6J2I2_9BACT|nr:glycosyltransferase family 9 protein [Chitinophaga horti]UYQ93778.1 glycosyltransferase family 9 protein [Chitinophaga horti]